MAKLVVEGLDELIVRFRQHPQKFRAALGKTMQASLLKIWELVPPYPEADPESSYVRTGTLGRSLGSSESGGRQSGQPDIYEVKIGAKYSEASFGTRLEYAPHVIGDKDSEQAWMHRGRWWTIPQTLVQKALRPVERLFQIMSEELAKWLDGQRQ